MRRIAGLLGASPSAASGAAATEPAGGGDYGAGPRPAVSQAANQHEIGQLVERVSAFLTSLLRQHDNDARLAERRFQQIERSVSGLRESVTAGLEWREKWAEVQGSVSGVIEESQMLARRVETIDERFWSKISGLDLAKQRGQDLENQVRAVEQQGRLAVASLEGAQKRQAAKLWRSERALEDVSRRLSEAEEALRWWAADGPGLPAADAAGGGCGGPGANPALTVLGGSPQELLRDLAEQVGRLSQRASRGETTLASLQSKVERLQLQAQETEGGGAQQAEEVAGVADRLRSVEAWLEDFSARRSSGDRAAVEQAVGLESRLRGAEGWLEELSQRGPEWDGQIASLGERLNGLEAWLADTQGWTAQVSAELGAQMAAEIGDLRERQTELLDASGSVRQLSEKVAALEAGVRDRHDELRALSEQAGSVGGELRSCQSEILDTSLTVRTLAEQAASAQSDLRHQQLQLAQAQETAHALSERVAGLGGELGRCQQELLQTNDSAACLAEHTAALEGDLGERREQLESVSGAMGALSERVAILDSSFRGCQRELVEAGQAVQSLAERASVIDCGFRERQDELSRLGASAEGSLSEQAEQLARLGEAVGALTEQVASLEGQWREREPDLRDIASAHALSAQASALHELRREVHEAGATRESLTAKVEELEVVNGGRQEELSRTIAAVKALSSQVDAAEGHCRGFEGRLGDVLGEVRSLAARADGVDALKDELSQTAGSVGALSTGLATLDGRFGELEGRVEETARAVSAHSARAADLGALKEALSETAGTTLTLSSGLDAFDGRLRELEGRMEKETLSSRLAALDSCFQELEGRVEKGRADEAERAASAISARAADVEALKAELSKTVGTLDVLSSQVATIDGHSRMLEGKLQETAGAVGTHSERISGLDALKDELSGTVSAFQALSSQVAAVDCHSRGLEGKLEATAETLSVHSARVAEVEALKEQLSETAEVVKGLSSQVSAVDGRSSVFEGKLEEALGSAASHSVRVAGDQEALKESLTETVGAVRALSAQVAAADTRARELEAKLVEAPRASHAGSAGASDLDALKERQEQLALAVADASGLSSRLAALAEGELTVAAGRAEVLSAQVTALERRQEVLEERADAAESLASRVTALDGGGAGGGGPAAAAATVEGGGDKGVGAVEALAVRVSTLDSTFRALADKVSALDAGSLAQGDKLSETAALVVSLAAKMEAADSTSQERHAEVSGVVRAVSAQVSALDGSLQECRQELSETGGTVGALASRVAELAGGSRDAQAGAVSDRVVALDDRVRSQQQELAESNETVRNLAERVETIQAELRSKPPLLQGPALGSSEGERVIRQAALEVLDVADAGVPSAEDVDQALERLQTACSRAAEATATAARLELAAALEGAESLDVEGLLGLDLERPEEMAALCDPEKPAAPLPGPAAGEGGPAREEAEQTELVDGALLRLHAACLEAAQGMASAARGELLRLELEPADCLGQGNLLRIATAEAAC